MLIYSVVIWNILLPCGIFYDNLANFVVIITRFGMFYHEKSGNPG
jgi:hypothetical protein